MTDFELLEKCIKDLGAINVPAYLLEQVTLPIYNVRNNLVLLASNIKKTEEKNKPEEPAIEVSSQEEEN